MEGKEEAEGLTGGVGHGATGVEEGDGDDVDVVMGRQSGGEEEAVRRGGCRRGRTQRWRSGRWRRFDPPIQSGGAKEGRGGYIHI